MVTDKQIAALKYLVFQARDGSDLSKQTIAHLIHHSDGLTREVCITLTADCEGYTADEIRSVAQGISAMLSVNGTTHLHELFHAMGSPLKLSLHYGDFDATRAGDPLSNAGQFAGSSTDTIFGCDKEKRKAMVRTDMPIRYTFWLADGFYAKSATRIDASRAVLDNIDLAKPGLYPELEKTDSAHV